MTPTEKIERLILELRNVAEDATLEYLVDAHVEQLYAEVYENEAVKVPESKEAYGVYCTYYGEPQAKEREISVPEWAYRAPKRLLVVLARHERAHDDSVIENYRRSLTKGRT